MLDSAVKAESRRGMNRSVLESIYVDHRQGLFTVALMVTGCRQHAEDAVQDAFSRLASNRAIDGDAVAYTYKCVRNAACDIQRKRARNRRISDSIFNGFVPERSGVTFVQGDKVLTQERDQTLRTAVYQLPDDYRDTVVMKIFANLTFRQIGEILNQPLKTVATRYRRALERLEESLKGKL